MRKSSHITVYNLIEDYLQCRLYRKMCQYLITLYCIALCGRSVFRLEPCICVERRTACRLSETCVARRCKLCGRRTDHSATGPSCRKITKRACYNRCKSLEGVKSLGLCCRLHALSMRTSDSAWGSHSCGNLSISRKIRRSKFLTTVLYEPTDERRMDTDVIVAMITSLSFS